MHLSKRAILILSLAAPLIAASAWLTSLGGVAAVYVLSCFALFVLDARLGKPAQKMEVTREHAEKLNLGIENPILLHIYNPGREAVVFWLRINLPSISRLPGLFTREPSRGGKTGRNVIWRLPKAWKLCLWKSNLTLAVSAGTDRPAKDNPGQSRVKVYPNLLSVQRYELLLRRSQLHEIGLRQVRQRGEGSEYERLREYMPDDDFRRIDWKALPAATGRSRLNMKRSAARRFSW